MTHAFISTVESLGSGCRGVQPSTGLGHVGHAPAVAPLRDLSTEPAPLDADPAVGLSAGGLHR